MQEENKRANRILLPLVQRRCIFQNGITVEEVDEEIAKTHGTCKNRVNESMTISNIQNAPLATRRSNRCTHTHNKEGRTMHCIYVCAVERMAVAGNPNQDLHKHIIEYPCKSMDSLKDYKTLRFLKLRGYLSSSSLVFLSSRRAYD